jgi:hypothetical protein
MQLALWILSVMPSEPFTNNNFLWKNYVTLALGLFKIKQQIQNALIRIIKMPNAKSRIPDCSNLINKTDR